MAPQSNAMPLKADSASSCATLCVWWAEGNQGCECVTTPPSAPTWLWVNMVFPKAKAAKTASSSAAVSLRVRSFISAAKLQKNMQTGKSLCYPHSARDTKTQKSTKITNRILQQHLQIQSATLNLQEKVISSTVIYDGDTIGDSIVNVRNI